MFLTDNDLVCCNNLVFVCFFVRKFRYFDVKIGFLLNPLENMPRVSYNKSYFIIMIMIN